MHARISLDSLPISLFHTEKIIFSASLLMGNISKLMHPTIIIKFVA